jgi:hypothetical protein
MRIKTNFENPPIPVRSCDWSAVDDDTYGGDPRDPIGRGSTEIKAIRDLLDQIEDRADELGHGITTAQKKVQGTRCGCRGHDDYCPCQNVPDRKTLAVREAHDADK